MAGRIIGSFGSKRRNNPKRARLSNRQKVALGVGLIGAAAVTVGGKHMYDVIAADRQKVAAIRAALETRIPNPRPWARLCRIYNLNPRSEQDISVIKIVNGFAQKYKTPPERIWYTWEKHLANQTEEGLQAQLTALSNASLQARSKEERERIDTIKSVVSDVASLKDKAAKKIILDALSTEGSHDALRAAFGFSD